MSRGPGVIVTGGSVAAAPDATPGAAPGRGLRSSGRVVVGGGPGRGGASRPQRVSGRASAGLAPGCRRGVDGRTVHPVSGRSASGRSASGRSVSGRSVPVASGAHRVGRSAVPGGAAVGGFASARWRGLVAVVAVGLGSAFAAFGLGAVAQAAAVARVPESTGMVVARSDETLWQLARRAAPSADTGAVVGRIVELNGLSSPSVRQGQVVVSPIE